MNSEKRISFVTPFFFVRIGDGQFINLALVQGIYPRVDGGINIKFGRDNYDQIDDPEKAKRLLTALEKLGYYQA